MRRASQYANKGVTLGMDIKDINRAYKEHRDAEKEQEEKDKEEKAKKSDTKKTKKKVKNNG